MRILASLVGGLNIRLVDISIRVSVGLRGLIGVIFIVKAGSVITVTVRADEVQGTVYH